MCEGTKGSTPDAAGERTEIHRGQLAGHEALSTEAGQTRSSAAASAEEVAGENALDLEFMCAEDVIYHRARQGFLLAAHRWAMFGAIIFGTAAASAAFNTTAAGVLVAVVSAADLCFDLTGRAQIHAELARRYHAIARKMLVGGDKTRLTKRYLDVSSDEVPSYPTARLVAFNAAILSLGRDSTKIEVPSRWRRVLMHIAPV